MTQGTPAINGFYARGQRDQFLSNFFFHPFTLGNTAPDSPVSHLAGGTAPTVEHFFQAAKTLDAQEALAVLTAPTAGGSKRLGRMVALRPDWEAVKYAAMSEILRSKFSDAELKKRLLATGDAALIEANHWHDTIWGVCTCAKHQNTGQNHLGRALMALRTEFSAPTT
jgi:ribA/ribD-fused uncharacterized protein